MKITYDAEVDAMYIYIRVSEAERGNLETKEMGNVNLDFSPSGNLVGIEILNASQYVEEKGRIQLELGPFRFDKRY